MMHKLHHQTLLSLALEATSDGIWGWHIPSGEAFFSKQYYTMLGYESHELDSNYTTWKKLLHPKDLAHTIACVEEHIKNKSTHFEAEFRLLTKQGDDLWILGRGKVIEWDEQNNPIYMVGNHVDINRRKRTEQKLARYQLQLQEMVNERTQELLHTSSLLEATLNAIPDVIGIQDNQHRMIRYNNAGYDFLKTSKEEIVGKHCYELIGRDSECEQCATSLCYSTKKPEAVVRYEEALDSWLDVRAYPIVDKDGNITKVIEHLRDITAEKKAETEKQALQEQLLTAKKMESLGTLAGGIAHDFNNLLMGIQGRASLMEFDQQIPESCQEHLRAIDEYIKGATNLTKQLLGFARGGKYEAKAFDINEMVKTSSSMFGRTRKDLVIYTDISPGSIIVEADKSQLEQVLLNLYINSWQAMPQGGSLTIRTSIIESNASDMQDFQLETGSYAKIEIIDTGVGMDKATVQRIFEPFFTTKDKGRGSGLGLASSYGIIENHGGIIHVESTVGKGSTFAVLLPLSENNPEAENITTAIAQKGEGSVLLVDDEQMILDVASQMLRTLGYRVTTACGGEDAISLIQKTDLHYDLVILDITMPIVDGSMVFDCIQAERPKLAVLLASGYTVDGKAASLMQKGCKGFIQKPFTIKELSQKIEKVFADYPTGKLESF